MQVQRVIGSNFQVRVAGGTRSVSTNVPKNKAYRTTGCMARRSCIFPVLQAITSRIISKHLDYGIGILLF